MVENLRSKLLYKIELRLLKIIPMILAFTALLNSILSYFNIDLYTDEELANIFKWSLRFQEELYQARMHDRIIVEGIEPPDELTEEEEHVPMQQLIDEAKSKWTV